MSAALEEQINRWKVEAANAEANAARAQVDLEKVRNAARRERRTFLGYVLVGLAVVAVVLAIIGAIWFADRANDDNRVVRDRARTETVRACLELPDAAERQLCVALLDIEAEAPADG